MHRRFGSSPLPGESTRTANRQLERLRLPDGQKISLILFRELPVPPIPRLPIRRGNVRSWAAGEQVHFADEYLERLAVSVIDSMRLGRGRSTDFLGISFSAPDYIGHAFGPDSLEIEDEYLRLDATIGTSARSLLTRRPAPAATMWLCSPPTTESRPWRNRRATPEPSTPGTWMDRLHPQERRKPCCINAWGADPRRFPRRSIKRKWWNRTSTFIADVMARINADPSLWSKLKDAMLVPGVESVFTSKQLQEFGGRQSDSARGGPR